MYSNTQKASRSPVTTWRAVMPRSPMATISPGATLRSSRAPMMSKAHDSEATQ